METNRLPSLLEKSCGFRRILLLLFLIGCGTFSQVCGMALEEDSFLLCRRVRNASAGGELKLAVCHPISNEVFCIPLDRDGRFSRRLPVVGTQDVYLYLFDAVTCLTFPGDTIELDYDEATRDFHLSGRNAVRSRELELEKQLYMRFRQREIELSDTIHPWCLMT